jgi:hypothetical protein
MNYIYVHMQDGVGIAYVVGIAIVTAERPRGRKG